jgi:Dyp-type peroxidase family
MVGSIIKSAWDEYVSTNNLRGPFCQILLTAKGYSALGEIGPASLAFCDGMIARGSSLGDPPPRLWESAYTQGEIHGMALLADDDPVRLARSAVCFRVDINTIGSSVVGEECGFQQRRSEMDIEHFGYADGISQPVFFTSAESHTYWDSSAGPRIALVEEPGRPGCFGSYLVFRKLEQDVVLWNHVIASLAKANEVDPEQVGAMLVGRRKDGSPLLDPPNSSGPNDFDFSLDPDGRLCPINSHMRRMNPRQNSGTSNIYNSIPRIVRRSMTYGLRPDLHPGGRLFPPPRKGVGLLFLAYQASIEAQFEYMQRHLANRGFNARGALLSEKVDPIIGRASGYDDGHTDQTARPEDAVRLCGGEYFFAPSLKFLENLGVGD